jgi:hypothetical protein
MMIDHYMGALHQKIKSAGLEANTLIIFTTDNGCSPAAGLEELAAKGHFPGAEFFFYRTSAGSEMDFVMRFRNKIFAIECKSSLSPQLSKGFYNAIEDINPHHSYVAAPVTEGWAISNSINIVSISELVESIQVTTTTG